MRRPGCLYFLLLFFAQDSRGAEVATVLGPWHGVCQVDSGRAGSSIEGAVSPIFVTVLKENKTGELTCSLNGTSGKGSIDSETNVFFYQNSSSGTFTSKDFLKGILNKDAGIITGWFTSQTDTVVTRGTFYLIRGLPSASQITSEPTKTNGFESLESVAENLFNKAVVEVSKDTGRINKIITDADVEFDESTRKILEDAQKELKEIEKNRSAAIRQIINVDTLIKLFGQVSSNGFVQGRAAPGTWDGSVTFKGTLSAHLAVSTTGVATLTLSSFGKIAFTGTFSNGTFNLEGHADGSGGVFRGTYEIDQAGRTLTGSGTYRALTTEGQKQGDTPITLRFSRA